MVVEWESLALEFCLGERELVSFEVKSEVGCGQLVLAG